MSISITSCVNSSTLLHSQSPLSTSDESNDNTDNDDKMPDNDQFKHTRRPRSKRGKGKRPEFDHHEPPESVSVSLSAYTRYKPATRKQPNRGSTPQAVPTFEEVSSAIQPDFGTVGHYADPEKHNTVEAEDKLPQSYHRLQRGTGRVFNSSPLKREVMPSHIMSPDDKAKRAILAAEWGDYDGWESDHVPEDNSFLESIRNMPVLRKSTADTKGERGHHASGTSRDSSPMANHITVRPAPTPMRKEVNHVPNKEGPHMTLSDPTAWPPLQPKSAPNEREDTPEQPPHGNVIFQGHMGLNAVMFPRTLAESGRSNSSGSRGTLNRDFQFPSKDGQTINLGDASPAPSETPMAFLAQYRDQRPATVPYEVTSGDETEEVKDSPAAMTTAEPAASQVLPSSISQSQNQHGQDYSAYKNQRDILLRALHGVAASGTARAAASNTTTAVAIAPTAGATAATRSAAAPVIAGTHHAATPARVGAHSTVAPAANTAVVAGARRTVMHDPMKEQPRAPPGMTGPQHPSVIGTRPPGYQPSGNTPAPSEISNEGWNPVTGQSEALTWRGRRVGIDTVETSTLTNEELRAHTQAWHEEREARFQLQSRSCLAHELRNKEAEAISEEWWKQDNRTQGQENLCSYLEEVNSRRANALSQASTSAAPDTAKLLIPLFCNLNSYMTESPYEGRGMFRDFKTPPEWSVDASSMGAGVGGATIAGSGRNESLFGQDSGAPPQRLGRDPRYRLVNDNGNTTIVQQTQQQPQRQAEVQHQLPRRPTEVQHQLSRRPTEVQHQLPRRPTEVQSAQSQQQQQAIMAPPPAPVMTQPQTQPQPATVQPMSLTIPQTGVQMQMAPSPTTAVPAPNQQSMMPMPPPYQSQYQPLQYQAQGYHQQSYQQQLYQAQQALFQGGGPRSTTHNTPGTTALTTTYPQHYDAALDHWHNQLMSQMPAASSAQQQQPATAAATRNPIPAVQQYAQMQQHQMMIHSDITTQPGMLFHHNQMNNTYNNVVGTGTGTGQFQFPAATTTTGGLAGQQYHHGQGVPHHQAQVATGLPHSYHHGGGAAYGGYGHGLGPGAAGPSGPQQQGPSSMMNMAGAGNGTGYGNGNGMSGAWWNGENYGGPTTGRF
ncbi:MAG: hypothetical protein M1816_003885 [Peltula sp. TS41687]|nr:MAG: hypothetical protein M1816_003885 [Peltula sp. TS41687]